MSALPASTTAELRVTGMSCASCVSHVEKALRGVPGVTDATVNLATGLARVHAERPVEERVLARAVVAAGYGVQEREAPPEDERSPRRKIELGAALGLAGVLMVLSMAPVHVPYSVPLQAVLSAVVAFGLGRRIFSAALRQAAHLQAGMDTLVAGGAFAAWAYSLAEVVRSPGGHPHVYFETAGMIVALILLGRFLESGARGVAGQAVRALLDTQPTTARVQRNGTEDVIPAEQVQLDDRVVVRPGERVPVDGVVVEGVSELDESLLTGEAMPVRRGPGETVVAGSANLPGALVIRATRVGRDTTLGHVARMVEDAQASRADVQRLADRVAAVFVPVVLAVAALTFAGWWAWRGDVGTALMVAISVLVIACPCAMGLATPTAILVGTGRAARMGILVRDAHAMELAGSVDTILFDKTGTLTMGSPRVVGEAAAPGHTVAEVLRVAGALAMRSEHPVSRALAERARAAGLDLRPAEQVTAVPGDGVMGMVDGVSVRVGRRGWHGTPVPELEAVVAGWDAAGRSTSLVVRGDTVLGALAVEDPVRPESADAVARLRALGIRPLLVTGDHAAAARAVGTSVGLRDDEMVTRARPEDKLARVAAERAAGHRVGFVGDGLNDAPALAAATVGWGMGTGTEAARASAGLVLLRSNVAAVADSVALSRATLRVVRQNLAWAMGYNIVCIPLAMTGSLAAFGGPMLAAGAMAFSSITVVLNSLRLRSVTLRG